MDPTNESRTLLFASGNEGKLREYRGLVRAAGRDLQLELLPAFAQLPEFEETTPTFAENAAGKALYYGRHAKGLLFADDSGLVVPALGGAPGVLSARYAGPGAGNEQKIAKLLREMRDKRGPERSAYFVCVITLVREGQPLAVVSAKVDGEILEQPRGGGGFGYDPVFYFAARGKSFAELDEAEKNTHSHRGKAFRRLLEFLDP
jgi:XTP/dITP diphosphohydrolase